MERNTADIVFTWFSDQLSFIWIRPW